MSVYEWTALRLAKKDAKILVNYLAACHKHHPDDPDPFEHCTASEMEDDSIAIEWETWHGGIHSEIYDLVHADLFQCVYGYYDYDAREECYVVDYRRSREEWMYCLTAMPFDKRARYKKRSRRIVSAEMPGWIEFGKSIDLRTLVEEER